MKYRRTVFLLSCAVALIVGCQSDPESIESSPDMATLPDLSCEDGQVLQDDGCITPVECPEGTFGPDCLLCPEGEISLWGECFPVSDMRMASSHGITCVYLVGGLPVCWGDRVPILTDILPVDLLAVRQGRSCYVATGQIGLYCDSGLGDWYVEDPREVSSLSMYQGPEDYQGLEEEVDYLCWTVVEGDQLVCRIRTYPAQSRLVISPLAFAEVVAGPHGVCAIHAYERNVYCLDESDVMQPLSQTRFDTIAQGPGGVLCGIREADAAIECLFPQLEIPGEFQEMDGSCAIDSTGHIHCWDENGQVEVREGSHFVRLTHGGAHYCALSLKTGVECWGDDQYGQASGFPNEIAFERLVFREIGCAIKEDAAAHCRWELPEREFQELAGGFTGMCWIRKDGVTECDRDLYTPTRWQLENIKGYRRIFCAIRTSDSALICWNIVEEFEFFEGRPVVEHAIGESEDGTRVCAILESGDIACQPFRDIGPGPLEEIPGDFISLDFFEHRLRFRSLCAGLRAGGIQCEESFEAELPGFSGRFLDSDERFPVLAARGGSLCGIRESDRRVQCWSARQFQAWTNTEDEFDQLVGSISTLCGIRTRDKARICVGQHVWNPPPILRP